MSNRWCRQVAYVLHPIIGYSALIRCKTALHLIYIVSVRRVRADRSKEGHDPEGESEGAKEKREGRERESVCVCVCVETESASTVASEKGSARAVRRGTI